MNEKVIIGAIVECRRLGEVLLDAPTLRAFAAYRRALTHLATTLGTADLAFARAVLYDADEKQLYFEAPTKKAN
jgi:hypothetical protein